MNKQPEFSPDWPHGWQTRDGKHKISRFMGTDSLGNVVFDTEENGVLVRYPGGYSVPGGTIMRDRDIINAPAPKHEPRKWWVVVYRMACRDTAVSTSYDNEKDARKLMDRHDVVPIAFTRIAEGDGLEGDK